MAELTLRCGAGSDVLSVREFSSQEGVSRIFCVSILAMSDRPDLDPAAIVGADASLHVQHGLANTTGGTRQWDGICHHFEQLRAETTGLSTYRLEIVPLLWKLTQRVGNRLFQHLSIPEILTKLLGEWSIAPIWQLTGAYPRLELRIQYGETDFEFFCRLLEEAGISFTFPDIGGMGTKLTLSDALQSGAPHPLGPLSFVDAPNRAAQKAYVTSIQMVHAARPGAHTLRDHDFRKPAFPLFGKAPPAELADANAEIYRYAPGAFLVEGGAGGGTPFADDKGVARHEQNAGVAFSSRSLAGLRNDAGHVVFETNVLDLTPGAVFTTENHPHPLLAKPLLCTELYVRGSYGGEWSTSGKAVFASLPYRPALVTPRPSVTGVQSASVVGPPGEEIHTDEFGRVRVQFPWDREGKNDDNSSCWMRVVQGWAGTGYGMMDLPRVGQEVLVAFLGGNPDQPVIVGRVFNGTSPVPYKLPDHKTRSTWKSESSPGGGGFNEILFEDLKGQELVYMQAEKNQRRLVKFDEVITVGHDRQKLVKANEVETTWSNRTEVTGGNRVELIDGGRTNVIAGALVEQVNANHTERTGGNHTLTIVGSQDIVVKGVKKETMSSAAHEHVMGDRYEQVDGGQSLTVFGDQQEKVGGRAALDAGQEIHLKAGVNLVVESGLDLTLKGPGGFVRIDAMGVTISGILVKINSGGAPGTGAGSSPTAPTGAAEAIVTPPIRPTPDDVSRTGLAQ